MKYDVVLFDRKNGVFGRSKAKTNLSDRSYTVKYALPIVGLMVCLSASPVTSAEDAATLGARAFRACAGCQSARSR